MQRETLRQTAEQQGISEDSFYQSFAKMYLERLGSEDESEDTDDQPINGLSVNDARRKLTQDPRFAIEYRQDLFEQHYSELVDSAAEWLEHSSWAQRMLDPDHLRTILPNRSSSTVTNLTELFVEAAFSLQVVAPLNWGFTASVKGETHFLFIGQGISDGLDVIAKLMIGSSLRVAQDGRPALGDLKGNPGALIKATSEVRDILEFASGKRPTVSTYELDPIQADMAKAIQFGGEAFVILHELAHYVLAAPQDPLEEEKKCDEFAAHLILASNNEWLACGLALGFMLLETLLRQAGHHRITETHPAIADRFYRISRLIAESGLLHSADALLSGPRRVYEEEFFRTTTQKRMLPNFAFALTEAWRGSPHADCRGKVATALVQHAMRLPTLEESTSNTIRLVDGQIELTLMIETRTAVAFALSVFAEWDSSDSDRNSRLAAEAAVRFLAYLSMERPPSPPAFELFHAHIVGQFPPPLPSKQFEIGIEDLKRIGCISETENGLVVNRLVGVKFCVNAQYF
jgi:hypothetical protein